MELFYELWDNEICNICITVLSSLNADASTFVLDEERHLKWPASYGSAGRDLKWRKQAAVLPAGLVNGEDIETLAAKARGSFYLRRGPKLFFSLEFLQNVILGEVGTESLTLCWRLSSCRADLTGRRNTIQITLAIRVIEYVWCQRLLSESGQTEINKM